MKSSNHSRDNAPQFRRLLLAWYDIHARDLPWREDRDPYRVWLSEIMLQQTRVAAVIEHYRHFLQRFPTVQKLAAARTSSVLAAWSGLGYYRRARMMHAAAKLIVRELDGQFPTSASGLRALPGVGRYTSAAVASIAFEEPVAVVDGNVERVLQRFSGTRLAPEKIWKAAENLLDLQRPGDFNQAMMELGATVCTPRTPSCLTCPVVDFCATRAELPSLAKPSKQEKREIHYALDCRNGAVYLVQRPQDAQLMAGMWELPQLETTEKANPPADFTVRHSITVTNYTVRVRCLPVPRNIPGRRIPLQKLQTFPLTGLARKILRKAELISGASISIPRLP